MADNAGSEHPYKSLTWSALHTLISSKAILSSFYLKQCVSSFKTQKEVVPNPIEMRVLPFFSRMLRNRTKK